MPPFPIRKLGFTVFALAAVTLGLSASGCSKAPAQDLQSAAASLEEARNAGADAYAPDSFSRAQQSLEQAKAEIAAQDKKFVLLRSYGKAKTLLSQARTDAGTAKLDSASNKQQFKGQAEESMTQARTSLEAARAALLTAPAGKDARADLEAMRGDLDGLTTALADAETAMTASDFAGAKQTRSSKRRPQSPPTSPARAPSRADAKLGSLPRGSALGPSGTSAAPSRSKAFEGGRKPCSRVP